MPLRINSLNFIFWHAFCFYLYTK